MYVYIWDRLEDITDNWHSEAAVVIVAPSLEAAHELFFQEPRPSGCRLRDATPTRVIPTNANEPTGVFIFQDAGCC